ncbi:MAG: hypothetical protein NTW89_08310 [Burkholderiales bacterium]|nr:hypothetical protein [Burkholderiales bacterium]
MLVTKIASSGLLLAVCSSAWAHPGHSEGLLAELMHVMGDWGYLSLGLLAVAVAGVMISRR